MTRSKRREIIINDRNAVRQLRNLSHVDEMAKDSGSYIWKMDAMALRRAIRALSDRADNLEREEKGGDSNSEHK